MSGELSRLLFLFVLVITVLPVAQASTGSMTDEVSDSMGTVSSGNTADVSQRPVWKKSTQGVRDTAWLVENVPPDDACSQLRWQYFAVDWSAMRSVARWTPRPLLTR